MNSRFSAIALGAIISVTAQFIPFAYSAPKKSQALYLGFFSNRWAYLLPETIKQRGNLRRFQVQTIYKIEQTSRLDGYKYTTSLLYWVANCTEGSIGLQQFIDFDSKGNQVGKSSYDLKLEFPDPNDMREKILDSACDYKNN